MGPESSEAVPREKETSCAPCPQARDALSARRMRCRFIDPLNPDSAASSIVDRMLRSSSRRYREVTRMLPHDSRICEITSRRPSGPRGEPGDREETPHDGFQRFAPLFSEPQPGTRCEVWKVIIEGKRCHAKNLRKTASIARRLSVDAKVRKEWEEPIHNEDSSYAPSEAFPPRVALLRDTSQCTNSASASPASNIVRRVERGEAKSAVNVTKLGVSRILWQPKLVESVY